jgi:hypothetical protein
MAREFNLKGLDTNTRRRAANRPFEDIRKSKSDISTYRQTEVPEKLAEESSSLASQRSRKLIEEPPTKARLTVREKKRNFLKTSISRADE